jgi:hypothetical protein
LKLKLARVYAIDQNSARTDIVETRQQVDQRTFSGAAGPDDRDDLAATNGERNPVEHFLGRIVSEMNVFKLDPIVELGQ